MLEKMWSYPVSRITQIDAQRLLDMARSKLTIPEGRNGQPVFLGACNKGFRVFFTPQPEGPTEYDFYELELQHTKKHPDCLTFHIFQINQ